MDNLSDQLQNTTLKAHINTKAQDSTNTQDNTNTYHYTYTDIEANNDIVDSAITKMESLHIRSSSSLTTDASLQKLPIIPLEVVQYFATDYFDDEDFVYQEFTLPISVLDAIHEYNSNIHNGQPSIEPYHKRVSQYLINKYIHITTSNVTYNTCANGLYLDNIDTNDKNNTNNNSNSNDDEKMQQIMRNIILLYENMVQYITICEDYGYESITAESVYEVAEYYSTDPAYFENLIYQTSTAIYTHINLNPTSPEYQDMTRYSQETLYGLGLIIRQIQCIMDTYANIGIHRINDGYSQPHIQRLFRLVNNMCVIMLFYFLIHEECIVDTYLTHSTSPNNLNTAGANNNDAGGDPYSCIEDAWRIGGGCL